MTARLDFEQQAREHPIRMSCITAYGEQRQLQLYFSDLIFNEMDWAEDLKNGRLFLRGSMSTTMPDVFVIEQVADNAPYEEKRIKVSNQKPGNKTAPLTGCASFNLATWFPKGTNFELFHATPVKYKSRETGGRKQLLLDVSGILRPCPVTTDRVKLSRQPDSLARVATLPALVAPAPELKKQGIGELTRLLNLALVEAHETEELSLKPFKHSTGAPQVRIERLAVYE